MERVKTNQIEHKQATSKSDLKQDGKHKTIYE